MSISLIKYRKKLKFLIPSTSFFVGACIPFITCTFFWNKEMPSTYGIFK
jgi:hypothetical protein